MDMAQDRKHRFRGCLLGLAVGDAVGTTLEFKPPGSFKPITGMAGGGPFRLKPGEWTDDTSMALCLATSLVETSGFDPKDQMDRYGGGKKAISAAMAGASILAKRSHRHCSGTKRPVIP
jgi:ADP-ribosylglycohydrolase